MLAGPTFKSSKYCALVLQAPVVQSLEQQLPIIVIKIQHCHCDLYITLWKKFSTLPIWLEFSPGYPSTTKLRDIASISKYTS